MPLRLIQNLKSKAGQMACGSVLYNWSLSEKAPERLIVKPADVWEGNPEKGRHFLESCGATEDSGPVWYDHWWHYDGDNPVQIEILNSFEWLRDLRAQCGSLARNQGQQMICSWARSYPNWDKETWRGDITGRRLAMWISHHEYFCAGLPEEDEDLFFTSLIRQAKHLYNTLGTLEEIPFLQAARGLIYAGLAIEGRERWIENALNLLDQSLKEQVLPDGGHASRSPARQLQALQLLLDIKSALTAGDYPVPEDLSDTIARMSTALRFFRYGDRRLATMNASQEGEQEEIDSTLAQAGLRSKPLQSLPDSGYERMEMGRSLVLFDYGAAPKYPYDRYTHAGPLSFEFSYGKERLFVSCGTHPTSPEWCEALRATSAHNTASLDYRNAHEIRKDGHFGRRSASAHCERQETREAILIDASHNGYVSLNGITHMRRLYLTDEGNDFRGEDTFTSCIDLTRPVEIAIRFHLHPRITVSLVNNDTEALLRMPGGIGWRFKFGAGILVLEDSIYLGDESEARKTKQLVIYGHTTGEYASVQWSLKKEG
ncbi:MAG: heparinase II/III family protein [Alphaproteobacteria bacterium]|nr:heparinase II/III family protein [Alphaproteobacteria bacterium]